MSYGGWQYLSARRLSGIAHTTVFNDDKYTPRREWDRMLKNLHERQPVLLYFTEDGHRQRFWRMDPTLAQRYFWNGVAWERRDPPLAHVTLAPSYAVAGKPGQTIDVKQDGQVLSGVAHRQGAPDVALTGSVRDARVFLKGGSGNYLLHQQADGALVGEWRGGGRQAIRLEPLAAAAAAPTPAPSGPAAPAAPAR
jgi:hypothetical protein